jgi:hypothetical protein
MEVIRKNIVQDILYADFQYKIQKLRIISLIHMGIEDIKKKKTLPSKLDENH